MKNTLVLTFLIFSSFSYAQEFGNERLKLDDIRLKLESSCKEQEGKLRFENLSEKIGEKPSSVCYRYSCDVEKSYAEVSYKICPQDKQSGTLLNIQKACLSLYGHKESKEGSCVVGSCLLGEKVNTDGNQIALNDVQVVCLDNENLSPAIVDDLRKWGKAVSEADNTRVQKPRVQSVKKQ
jgi:hypothetical protein